MSGNMITGPLAGQFERYGDGWVYRQDGRGPALPLSTEEKDRFLAAYGWRLALTLIGFMAG